MRIGILSSAAIVAAVSVSACSKNDGPVTVKGTDDIFAAGYTGPPLAKDQGAPPPSIEVKAGETLSLAATGQITCCSAGGAKSGPDGNGGASHITNGLKTEVGGYDDPTGAFALSGVFLGGPGPHKVFKIGAKSTVTVPAGATRLYLGIPDANGFNGASGTYDDNGGELKVTVHRG